VYVDKSSLTNKSIETFKTRLNPYGFIYIPKRALSKLPFKTGDEIQLKIDKANKCVFITPAV